MANGLAGGFQAGFQMASQARQRREQTALQQNELEQRANKARTEQVQNTLKELRSNRSSLIEQATTAVGNAATPEEARAMVEQFRPLYQGLVMQEANLARNTFIAMEQSGMELPEGVPGPDQIVERELSQFDAVVGSTLSAQEMREREAETEAEVTRARRRATIEVDRQFGIPDDAKDEFNRNLNRLTQLEDAGQTDTEEYRRLAARVAKQTESSQTGMTISFDPNTGQFTMTQGPAEGLGGALSGQQALTQQAGVDRVNTVLDIIDTTIGLLEESPTRAGVIGGVRNFAQRLMGVAGDAAPEVIANTALQALSQIPGIPKDQETGIAEFFDPALPETDIYMNTIALELAKMRVLSGGGSIRAIESAFRAAQRDVAIRGAFSSQDALARLRTVREEFETERENLLRRLGGGEPQPRRAPQQDAASIPEPIQQAVPQGMTLGERLPDGRWQVFDGEGNLMGYIEE